MKDAGYAWKCRGFGSSRTARIQKLAGDVEQTQPLQPAVVYHDRIAADQRQKVEATELAGPLTLTASRKQPLPIRGVQPQLVRSAIAHYDPTIGQTDSAYDFGQF